MVNIQSVVHVTGTLVQSFDSLASYYAAMLNGADAEYRAKQLRLRRVHALVEQGLSTKYDIPLTTMTDVCFLFGTHTNAIRSLRDAHTRELVCDLNNKIVVQVRINRAHCDVVTTVWRPFDHQTIASSFNLADAQPSNLEQ